MQPGKQSYTCTNNHVNNYPPQIVMWAKKNNVTLPCTVPGCTGICTV